MDLTPFLSALGVVVGALLTFGGVAVNTHANRKAEDRRLELEAAAERARLEREDETSRRASEESRLLRAAQLYTEISQGFMAEISNVRGWRSTDSDYRNFDKWFNSQWPMNGDTRMRRAIAGVMDDGHRLRMTQILDAVIDRSAVGLMEFELEHVVTEKLFMLGFDLTATYARGTAIGADLEARWHAFEEQVRQANEWTEQRRQEKHEEYMADIQRRQEEHAKELAAAGSDDESPF